MTWLWSDEKERSVKVVDYKLFHSAATLVSFSVKPCQLTTRYTSALGEFQHL